MSKRECKRRGQLYLELRDALYAFWLLFQDGQMARARAVLEEIPEAVPGHQDSVFLTAYHRALIDLRTGDHRACTRSAEEAIAQARRMQNMEYEWMALNLLANNLQRSGRHKDAFQIWVRRLQQGDDTASCERALCLHSLAWWLLQAHESRVDMGALAAEAQGIDLDPVSLLQEVRALLRSDCDPVFIERTWPGFPLHVMLNMALALLQEGSLPEADRYLARAEQLYAQRTALNECSFSDLRGRILASQGRAADALQVYRELEDEARSNGMIEFEWKALYGQAVALEALDSLPEALAAWERCELLLYEHSLLVPIHLGRDAFLSQRMDATKRHVALLLGEGRVDEALKLIRRSRARFLLGLNLGQRLGSLTGEERQAWERQLERYLRARDEYEVARAQEWQVSGAELAQLHQAQRRLALEAQRSLDTTLTDASASDEHQARPPQPGELQLTWFETRDGWQGFCAGPQGLVHKEIGPLDLASDPVFLAERLLVPFAAHLAEAERITLLPSGALRGLDLHAAMILGEPLGLARPVAHSLDLGREAQAPLHVLQTAVLVADPRGDLRNARQEGRSLARQLPSAGVSVRLLEGREAGRAAVLEAISGADVFHYAGHGVYSEEVLDGELLLADGGLNVADVLALTDPPRMVILSGCETGRTQQSEVESIAMAQAFVAAGTQAVVATTRPVEDDTARAFSLAFFQSLAQAPDPGAAMQRALKTLTDQRPRADWATFRLLEP